MRIGLFSQVIGQPRIAIEAVVDEVVGAERAGFASYVVPNVFSLDGITLCALLGQRTQSIELMTGVVPAPPRHPHAMAQQALTAQVACGGRFALGIGLSHAVVIESMLGLSYARPARQMREYLSVLMPLLRGERADFDGELYRVHASLQVACDAPVPVLVAALGPRMLALTGQLADGTVTWMTGERTLAEHIVPSLTRAAESAGRPAPRIVAALPISLTDAVERARATASRVFDIYGTLPSYRAMLDREGAQLPGDVALVGDETELRAALGRLEDAGVTDYVGVVYDPDSADRTRAFLEAEARVRS